MAKPNFETFLDLLQRSGLIDKDRLQLAIAQSPKDSSGNTTTDVDELAQFLVSIGLITGWQSERLLEGRHKGFFLGRYKLLDLVAAGGMSTVYLAEHILMQRRVAIKVLPKTRVTDTSYLARFHREAQASASLDHNNIVRVFDVDNEGDIHYMVMEYVEGRDLQRIVKQDGRMSYTMAADFIRQAAEGLAHAHAAGLIHRDVKPANLLVAPKGVVKVLDLGLARFTDDTKASLTVQYDENVLGTADYLAPEQAIDSHGVDARADIYSLGCSLYYLLTGHPPFPEGTLPQRLMAHQRTQPPSILIDRPDCPPDLIAICTKMMAKKAADRYTTMFEVAQALQRWLKNYKSGSGSGVRAAAPGSGTSGGNSFGPNPSSSGRMTTLSNGTLSSGTSSTAGTVAQRSQSGTPRPSTIAPTKNPALSETVSNADTESHTPKPQKASESDWLSPSKAREKRALPVAQPLNAAPSRTADPSAVDVESIFGSGPMSRSSGVALNARPKGKRAKAFKPPKWMWAAIGGMTVVGVLLMILLYTMSANPRPSTSDQSKSTAETTKPAGPLFPDAPGSKTRVDHPFPDAPGSKKSSK